MQELHDQLVNLQVTEAEQYDAARVVQELRRICVELGALGDTVVPARKSHAFFCALPDCQYESLKTVLLCDTQRVALPQVLNIWQLVQRLTMLCKFATKSPLKKKVRDETNMIQAVASVR